VNGVNIHYRTTPPVYWAYRTVWILQKKRETCLPRGLRRRIAFSSFYLFWSNLKLHFIPHGKY